MKKLHTDPKIHQTRRRWINFMKQHHVKKTETKLEDVEDRDARCCLGHACYVLGLTSRVLENEDGVYGITYNGEDALLPCEIQKELMIDAYGSFSRPLELPFEYNGRQTIVNIESCTQLNDNTNLSTQEIAVIIEEQMVEGNLATS